MTALTDEQFMVDAQSEADADRKNEQRGTASVLKALQLLDEFLSGEESMGVSDIARRAGVPTSTAYRLLAYLVESGFVSKEGTRYRPGDKLFELGNRVAHSRPRGLREQVAPYLGELYAVSGMTTRLAILDRADIVIVDKVVGLRTLPAPTAIGGRAPATCTALGKALLAFQPTDEVAKVLPDPLPRRTRHSITNLAILYRQFAETRATGLAYDKQESVLGQVCVAAPIVCRGKAVAAISLSAPAVRVNLAHSEAALTRAVRQIERTLVV
ncbi:IclR family transcriptional regulator [Rhodococcus rhodochrous]|uniref:IclR family transcriptional regulator n=1 Tax=Rhodococcus rhodochrous TaxID=1829 RepID=UPI0011C38B32|nr:IclR family transcriptional regulator [Rhodococcus rhodochrous]MDO1484624.1 IclR family transcriptional regulator [Rhodococcus rhodochrous]